MRVLLCCLVLLSAAAGADEPLLQLNPGGHMALITDIAFTPDGRFLVSASNDKQIHVWDIANQRIVRSLRGQIGAGDEGKIYAMALSPDGSLLAAGGWMKIPGEEGHHIRLYDFASGELLTLLKGHENVVLALAFSPDGRRLVSGSQDNTARVWEVGRDVGRIKRSVSANANTDAADGGYGANTRALIRPTVLRGHSAEIYAVAFTADSRRVVTGSNDHDLRLWDAESGKLLHTRSGHGDKVYAVAVAPDGKILSGDWSGEIRLWDGQSGEFLRVFANQGTVVGSLSVNAAGTQLLSGVGSAAPTHCHLWSYPDGKVLQRYTGHDNVVIATAFSPDGRWAATGGGANQEIHLWSTSTLRQAQGGAGSATNASTGSPTAHQRLAGSGAPVWAVGFSSDGAALLWGNTWTEGSTPSPQAKNKLEYHLRLPNAQQAFIGEPQTLQQMPSLEEMASVRAATTWQDWSLQHRQGGNYGRDAILEIRQGDTLKASIERGTTDGYGHRAYTFTPDGQTLISGGGAGVLTAYHRDGSLKGKFIGHTGDVWAVAVSPDGKLLVSGSDDQTVKLWNVATQENLLTLFYAPSPPAPLPEGEGSRTPSPSGRGQGEGEWVIWTPQGYYAASPGGDKLVGWHINQGADKAADYVYAQQLRDTFYRPALVAQAVLLGSAEKAIAAAGEKPFDLARLNTALPPKFEIDKNAIEVKDGVAKIPLRIAPGSELKDLELYVNGSKISGRGTPVKLPDKRDGFIRLIEVPVAAGNSKVEMRGGNDIGTTLREVVIENTATSSAKKGTLYLLAIGVNEYAHLPDLAKLDYAGDDAFALRDALLHRHGGVYNAVKTLLLAPGGDKEPTADNIQDALDFFAAAKPEDTAVLFLAGHGILEGQDYYFLPSDAEMQNNLLRKSRVLSWSDLHGALQKANGRRILLVDTCRAANAFNPRLIKDAADSNILAFSATGSNGIAQELSDFKHGAFTYALLQGIGGEADKFAPKQEIWMFELNAYLSGKVRELTQDSQNPQTYLGAVEDFLFTQMK